MAANDPTYALRDALICPKAKPRTAIIEPTPLGKLFCAIDGCNAHFLTRVALQLKAILVQRPGELRLANWDDVDLEAVQDRETCAPRFSPETDSGFSDP